MSKPISIYNGDFGTEFRLDCEADISDATALEIIARKPDGTEATWPASAVGTTEISYITASGDIDAAGEWRLQARVTTASGQWLGKTVQLWVREQFN